MENLSADRFEVEEEIGRGSFVRVHRAMEVATGASYAVKLLCNGSRAVLHDFRNEALLLGSLTFDPEIDPDDFVRVKAIVATDREVPGSCLNPAFLGDFAACDNEGSDAIIIKLPEGRNLDDFLEQERGVYSSDEAISIVLLYEN